MPLELLIKEDFQPRGLDEVAKRLGRKAAVTPEEFAALTTAQRRAAFTFGEVHKAGVIQRLRNVIATALKNGTAYRDVRLQMLRVLRSAGIDTVPFHRLRFLFQHHAMRTMAEAQDEFLAQPHMRRAFPYFQYKVVQSPGHRESHEAFADKVFRADDPFWDKYTPPWDWGCKCYRVPRSEAWVKRNRVKVENGGAFVEREGVEAGAKEVRLGSTTPDLSGLDADLRKAVEAALEGA